jgi:GTP cyclohydrolase II
VDVTQTAPCRLAERQEPLAVRVLAVADLPTRFGEFRIASFEHNRGGDHVAVFHGDLEGATELLVRVHSECLTGDVLGSLRCDCRDQLHHALTKVAGEPRGCVVYLRQEGRGIGLANKVAAYALQDRGLDTVDANRALGFEDDTRDYEIAAGMLAALGVRSIRLMTNNPDKVQQLTHFGMVVSERVPHELPANGHNRSYLQTKAERSGHVLPGVAPHFSAVSGDK